jgi:mono/diheme cytochrome c family protein
MRVMKFISLAVVIMLVSSFVVAQNASSESVPAIKHVPITNVPSNSGKEMFKSYCAVCHGADAKGNGPAAAALKAHPADLTLLAQKNGGKYPSAHVASVLRGQAATPSHDSQDMPIWGPLFSNISQGHEAQVQQRTGNLVAYIQTLQAK